MKLHLNRGFETVFDDEDWPILKDYEWYVQERGKNVYVRARDIFGDTVYMHRLVLGIHGELEVDHKNGDTLDNRRSNLRIATVSQNRMNRKKFEGYYSSPYKGVSFKRGKWRAQITLDKKVIHIGTFETELEAAKAYNDKALELHGEFAKLNDLPN